MSFIFGSKVLYWALVCGGFSIMIMALMNVLSTLGIWRIYSHDSKRTINGVFREKARADNVG